MSCWKPEVLYGLKPICGGWDGNEGEAANYAAW
jgi:hypothetical protein